MSGNAALASARRRRAGPSSNPAPPVRAPQRSPAPPAPINTRQTQPQQQQNGKPQKVNPLQLVIDHGNDITKMKEEISQMKSQLETLLNVDERISKIEGQLDSDLNLNNIAFFKEKYETIKKQLDDIKRLVVKVQTFSMETNLSVIELKKAEKMSTETLDKNDARSEHISNVLIEKPEPVTNSEAESENKSASE